MLVCLLAFLFAGRVSPIDGAIPVSVTPVADPAGPGEADGSTGRRRASIAFSLPPAGEDASRRVLWVPRQAVDALELRRGEWRSGSRSFFEAAPDEGLLPAGFRFPLPDDWTGEVALEASFESRVAVELRPEILHESRIPAVEQYGAMMAAGVYTSLLIVGLLALALFLAARDRAFLALLGYAMLALAALMALNGHIYQLPLLSGLARWREGGVWALVSLLTAGWLQMLVLYSELDAVAPRARRAVDLYCAALAATALACLVDIPLVSGALPHLLAAGWLVGSVVGLLVMADAGRRSVYMGWTLFFMALITAVASFATGFAGEDGEVDPVMTRYAYQFGVTFGAVILFVGLIARISEYRVQRDSDRRAREETERRMRQEAARTALVEALQSRLRSLPLKDIEPAGLRLLVDHLVPVVPALRCAAVLCGHHGRDVMLAEPASRLPLLQHQVSTQGLALKRLCAAGIAVQQPVTAGDDPHWVGVEAVVPLAVHQPAWGALLLRRSGADGFATDELTLAGDLARLAMLHIDHAVTAANLRRSAETDVLTGCFNRRTIDQWLDRAFSEAERDGEPLSILFIDLDNFKAINDRHGHACGDVCLCSLADALRCALPEGGVLGRYGGDEFIAILAGAGGAAARVVGERMRAAAEDLLVEWSGQPQRLTVSVGIATRRDGEGGPAATIDRADKALYAAKRNGRNCVQVAPAVFS